MPAPKARRGKTIAAGIIPTVDDGIVRSDPIVQYITGKYDVTKIAHLLLRVMRRIEEEGRPTDMDVIDRWLIEVNHTPSELRERARAAAADKAVIYYIRFADRVKIGTTTNMRNRMASLPHDEVLVTEPGYFDLEAMRHAQFAHLRIGRTEWFRYDGELVSHIEMLRAHFAGRDSSGHRVPREA